LRIAADKLFFSGKTAGNGPEPPGLNRTGVNQAEFGQKGLSGPGKPAPDPRYESPITSRQIRPGTEVLATLTAALGIPGDALSAALISFARYFSLPPEPALFLKLRREVLSLKTPREAGALAATAAADKGVELDPRALESYAAAIEGFGTEAGETHGENADSPGAGDQAVGGRSRGGDPGDEAGSAGFAPPEGGDLREKVRQKEADLPLLGLLNRLPGRDKRRWQVFPFTWSSGGVEFHLSLRLALSDSRYGEHPISRLALDIQNDRRRWSFVLDKPGTEVAETRVTVYPPPPGMKGGSLRRELGELLGSLGGPVNLRFEPEEPLFGDCKNDILLSVNEEV
jgi:hypothetical protein